MGNGPNRVCDECRAWRLWHSASPGVCQGKHTSGLRLEPERVYGRMLSTSQRTGKQRRCKPCSRAVNPEPSGPGGVSPRLPGSRAAGLASSPMQPDSRTPARGSRPCCDVSTSSHTALKQGCDIQVSSSILYSIPRDYHQRCAAFISKQAQGQQLPVADQKRGTLRSYSGCLCMGPVQKQQQKVFPASSGGQSLSSRSNHIVGVALRQQKRPLAGGPQCIETLMPQYAPPSLRRDPVEFVTAEQEQQYGGYTGELSETELASYFSGSRRLRGAKLVARDHNRLDFAANSAFCGL